MSATVARFATEQSLADAVLSRLRARDGVALSFEAPVLGRSVDLALYLEDELHTIEFKLHDWRRAIRQAGDHMLAADFAFICMPARSITPAMREAFEGTGIGLLFYADTDWPFETAIAACRSTVTWSVAYENLKKHIHQQHD